MFSNKKITSFFKIIKKQTLSKTVEVKGGTLKVMSSFGVMFETIKSIKDGICPIIRIVDIRDIEDSKKE